MDILEVGKIVNTHGLKGEVKVVPWTDYPEVFEEIENVSLKNGQSFEIKGVKYQKNNIILKLSGVDKIEDAEKLKNSILFAEKTELGELPEGVYYVADLIGLMVKTDEGEILGTISDVINTGANDIYEVKREDKKPLLIPVIDDVVLNVSIDKGEILVHLMEGLLDL